MRAADLSQPFWGSRSTTSGTDGVSASDAARAMSASYRPLLRPGQFFSHVTAALLWSCPLPRSVEQALPLHVTSTAPARAPQRSGVSGHQATATTGAVAIRHGLPVADPVTTFLQLASVLELDDLVAVADHLILDPFQLDPKDIRPYVDADELRARVATFTGRGARSAASAVLLMRQRAESRRETLLRLLLVRAGFPEPEVNPTLFSDAGTWLGRADLVFRQWKVIVEYDGDQHRTSLRQYEDDIARVERFTRAGWIVVKVRNSGLFGRQAHTIARVEEALVGRGWRR